MKRQASRARPARLPAKGAGGQARAKRKPPREKVPAERRTGDPGLLAATRMQWQFGDWDSLAATDPAILRRHPDRGPIALFVAAAHLQLGDGQSARSALELARRWKCDRGLMLRVLQAGVHNSLARLAAVRGEEGRALAHFRAAVEGVDGDGRLAGQARALRELGRLDLLDQAFRTIQPPRPELADGGPGTASRRLQAGGLRELAEFPAAQASTGRTVIVVAGMRHAGSTALFNILRLGLEQSGRPFESLYSEGPKRGLLNDPECALLLVKTHELRDDILAQATLVFTTRRDLRDTIASARRRAFPMLDKLGGAIEYAKYNRALHDVWARHSHFELVYEDYMLQPERETARVLACAGLQDADPASIHSEVIALPADQYETTLFNTHVTDPARVRSYADTLNEGEIARITMDHRIWLRRHGYLKTA